MHKLHFLFFIAFSNVLAAQTIKGFEIIELPQEKVIKVQYNGQLLTSYCYYDSIRKPILFPLNTIDGITITRGFPISPVTGERTDHPHHTGMWLNYESVNGLDFWNNSTAIAPAKRASYGMIVHNKVVSQNADKSKATLVVMAKWQAPSNEILLDEITTYNFLVSNEIFYIERITKLSAKGKQVVFKDVKDGFFAIRLARELEMAKDNSEDYVDHDKAQITNHSDIATTGMYYNSEGIKGDSVWGKQAKWVMLKGQKQGKLITVGIMDHPSNIGYPAYWHARGYGLFAVNPLGRKVFSKGRDVLDFTLPANKTVTFRYKVVIASGKDISAEDMNKEVGNLLK